MRYPQLTTQSSGSFYSSVVILVCGNKNLVQLAPLADLPPLCNKLSKSNNGLLCLYWFQSVRWGPALLYLSWTSTHTQTPIHLGPHPQPKSLHISELTSVYLVAQISSLRIFLLLSSSFTIHIQSQIPIILPSKYLHISPRLLLTILFHVTDIS